MTNTTELKNKIPLFQRLAEFFFIIYLITLYIFVDRLETLVYSNIAFILFAGCAVFRIMQRKRIYIGKNMLTAYIAVTWMQVTTFWASNTYLAGDRMKTMWLLFALFFITYNLFYEKEDAHAFLLKGLYMAGITLVIYSINIYGISGTIEMMTAEGGVRLGSEINQENSFGMMHATTIMIGFYYLLYKKSYKIFHIAVISGAFLFAMSSGSRKALLMMCIGVLLLIYKRYGLRKLYKVIAVGVVVVFLFSAVIQLPAFDFIRERMDSTIESFTGDSRGDASQRLRSKMIRVGWKLFSERILNGYGANNFAAISGFWTYSHNNFIEMLVDFGIIGFALYYLIYLIGIKNLWKSTKEECKVLLIITLVRIMMEMAMVSYYSKEQWIILAFSMINCGITKNSSKKFIGQEMVTTEFFENETEEVAPKKIRKINEGEFCECENIS